MLSVEFLLLSPERQWLAEADYKLIQTPEELQEVRDILLGGPKVAREISFDCETTGLNPFKHKMVGCSLSWKEGQGIYIPMRHRYPNYPDLDDIRRFLQDVANVYVFLAHNAKFDVNFLEQEGVKVKKYQDTMWSIVANNSNEKVKGLKPSVKKFLGLEMIELPELFQGKRKEYPFDEVDPVIGLPYTCGDSDAALRLFNLFAEARKQQEFITKLEAKVIDVVRRMENRGMVLNYDFLSRILEYIYKDLIKLADDIYKAAGKRFDILSGPQFAKILLEMGFTLELSEKKKYILNKAALEKIEHPIAEKVIKYRQLMKYFSTYVFKLWEHSETGERARFRFNQYAAATGRFSSGDDKDDSFSIKKKADPDDGYIAVNIQSIPSADKAVWFKAPQILKRYDKITGDLLFEDKPKIITESMRQAIITLAKEGVKLEEERIQF